jgi:hypothetical protein
MAVGYEGRRIFIVPGKNLVVVFTGKLEGKDNFIPDKLLSSYIIPAASSPTVLPQNRKGTARLSQLTNDVAEAFAYIWTTESEGIAEDYIFTRSASPAFQFEYPMGSYKAETDAPNQIMRMKSGAKTVISASIIDIPGGIPIEEFGPKFYLQDLKKHGSAFKVVQNKEITLQCGTKAYRTDIKWLWNKNVSMTTFLVSVYKEGKSIYLHTLTWDNPDRCEQIINSLTFN